MKMKERRGLRKKTGGINKDDPVVMVAAFPLLLFFSHFMILQQCLYFWCFKI